MYAIGQHSVLVDNGYIAEKILPGLAGRLSFALHL